MVRDLGTHDIDDLLRAHGTLPKPSKDYVAELTATLDTLAAAYPVVPSGTIKGFVEKWGEEKRFTAAAWRWLMPQAEPLLHEALPSIQQRAKLTHVPHDRFLVGLSEACRAVMESHPEMRTHIEARLSEIDFRMDIPRTAHTLDAEFSSLIASLTQTATWSNTLPPEDVKDRGLRVANLAVAGVCNEVWKVLSPKSARSMVNGNLMVSSEHLPIGYGRSSASADKLWGGHEAWKVHRHLVLVCETGQTRYFDGFWIPDIRHGGVPLPGAPRALLSGRAERLVCGDLPPFPIPDDDMKYRWMSYMSGASPGSFTFDVCISIPVVTPKGLGATPTVIGVVNVNFQSPGLCARALSRSWRDLANQRAQCWLAVLWPALQLALHRDDARTLSGEDGSPVLPSGRYPQLAEETTNVGSEER